MAKWERYIVYPLLFVALFFGVARETRILQAAENVIDEIRARRVVVVDEAGREQVVLRGTTEDEGYKTGGLIEVFGGNGQVYAALGTSESGGLLLVRNPVNKSAAYLWAHQEGGQFKLFTPEGEQGVILAALAECGMFGLNNPVNPEQPGVMLAINASGAMITLNNPMNTEYQGVVLAATEDGGWIGAFDKFGRLNESIGSP